jgi:Gluconate 2-dehydrogenase subunit 3
MYRREVLQSISMLLGSAFVSPALAGILEGKTSLPQSTGQDIFSTAEKELITEIADLIIPDTSTPGAKQAGVAEFIQLIVNECYKVDEQSAFKAGLAEVDNQAKGIFQKTFLESDKTQREDVLRRIEARAQADKYQKPFLFWFAIKELTVTGYFTSEIGAKQALSYLWVPGRYNGCIDLTPEQKTWAT